MQKRNKVFTPRETRIFSDQTGGTLAQKVVVAGGSFVVVGELRGPNLFPVLEGIFHRVEGAALGGALGHHHHLTEGGLQTVSPHECLRGGFHAKGLLADDQSLLAEDVFLQLRVLHGVNDVQTGADDGDGFPMDGEAALVGGGVAAQCQARHDHIAFLCELHCEVVGFCAASGIGRPSSDDGHALFSLQEFEVAPQPQPFGTILANGPQRWREQLGALGDFDDGIGHDGWFLYAWGGGLSVSFLTRVGVLGVEW